VAFQQGHKKIEGSGRQKGQQNALTKTVKETVLNVFNDLQGDPETSLNGFAKKYPRDFYQIAAKLIPTEITGQLDTQITHIERTIISKKV